MYDDRTERALFTDKAGHEVRVGDYIVYGHNLGRCAGIRFGKVLKIETVEKLNYARYPEDEWHILVRGVDDDWSNGKMELCQRNGTLMFPSRILKVNDIIPDEYIELLKDVVA